LNFRLSQKVNIGIKEIPEKRAGQREMAKKHVPNAANILQIFFAGTTVECGWKTNNRCKT